MIYLLLAGAVIALLVWTGRRALPRLAPRDWRVAAGGLAGLAFLAALLTGHWAEAKGVATHAASILGLILGGLIAAPFAGVIARIAPRRILTYGVGAVVLLSFDPISARGRGSGSGIP